ncbi:hypothetical protein AZI87_10630 [Bdellovibrio bacteriovorus]|uniref:Uncharacterized protein n=1 Tax=Bdellovibrio bacteriovorus TaxID=959 RepID=A0A162G5J3_BDEBC|nr:hypothetical protein [Bdellovibrio bacteriovorus]KYG65024.1 hypothetical protein AZI87_10630 [Bdellovibrio bacteriovorus]
MLKEAKINAWLLFGPYGVAFIFLLISPLLSDYGYLKVLMSVGFALILFAKLSLKLRSKKLIEWGSGDMTRTEKIIYYFGYLVCLLVIVNVCYIYIMTY